MAVGAQGVSSSTRTVSPGKNEAKLLEASTELPVIDAHEHLVTEKVRISRRIDFFMLFSHYTRDDFRSAGMPIQTYERLRDDQDMRLEEKWAAFSPFYPLIRYGSYARPASIWLQDVLGYGGLTERNYKEVSDRLQESNREGLYHRVLRDMCGIRTALVANSTYREYDFDLLKPLWRLIDYTQEDSYIRFLHETSDHGPQHVEAYLDWMEADFEEYMGMGGIGIKAMCFPYAETPIQEADRILRKWREDGKHAAISPEENMRLTSVIYDRAFRLAEQKRVPVAVHSGVWGDFRNSQPAHLIPMATDHPMVSFDLFHLGMPYVREAVMIGKMFPNVSLNMCWNTIVSPEQTVRMLDECMDMIPINNIIAFGGDYRLPVEKVYGHLKMARGVVARVLAKRMSRGQLDLAEALRIAGMWFYENPMKIYHLPSKA